MIPLEPSQLAFCGEFGIAVEICALAQHRVCRIIHRDRDDRRCSLSTTGMVFSHGQYDTQFGVNPKIPVNIASTSFGQIPSLPVGITQGDGAAQSVIAPSQIAITSVIRTAAVFIHPAADVDRCRGQFCTVGETPERQPPVFSGQRF